MPEKGLNLHMAGGRGFAKRHLQQVGPGPIAVFVTAKKIRHFGLRKASKLCHLTSPPSLMKLPRLLFSLAALAVTLGSGLSRYAFAAEPAAAAKTYKTAIFVANRAGPVGDPKVQSLEDYVTSRVTDLGVGVISRETAAQAVAKIDAPGSTNAVDTALAQNTTALRLAQTLGADYLLHA